MDLGRRPSVICSSPHRRPREWGVHKACSRGERRPQAMKGRACARGSPPAGGVAYTFQDSLSSSLKYQRAIVYMQGCLPRMGDLCLIYRGDSASFLRWGTQSDIFNHKYKDGNLQQPGRDGGRHAESPTASPRDGLPAWRRSPCALPHRLSKMGLPS